MKVAFRADASTEMGSGHVMRCRTLAECLRQRGAEVLFLCRELPGHYCDWLEAAGVRVLRLAAPASPLRAAPAGPPHAAWLGVAIEQEIADAAAALSAAGPWDWLAVDHYGLDAAWETAMRAYAKSILAIDDLADRRHDCSLLLDQNLQQPDRYGPWLAPGCRVLSGPRYALLRPEFAGARNGLPPRSGQVRRILVSFGGVDADNHTAMALRAIDSLGRDDLAVDVVMGAGNRHRQEIETLCGTMKNTVCHWNVADMATLLAAADLAVGAVGSTTWERACLGVAALVVTVADNQRPIAAAAEGEGILTWLGDGSTVSPERLRRGLVDLLTAPERVADQAAKGMALVDGLGVGRVAEAMAI